MALVYIDGFDHYAAAEVSKKGWTHGGNAPLFSSSYSRRSGIGQGILISGAPRYMQRTVITDDVWTVGVAVWCDLGTAWGTRIIQFCDSSTIHIGIAVLQSGTLYAERNISWIAQSEVGIVTTQTWGYLEARVLIHDTTGEITVKWNGNTAFTYSGDTRNAANSSANVIRLGCGNSGTIDVRLDDLYISNGDSPDEFLGDVYVDTVLPDADGDVNEWTANTGNRYQAVDDPTDIDDETTYVYETVNEQKQLFSMGALSSTLTSIKAVQEVITARKDTSPAVNIRPLFRTTGDAEYEAGLGSLGDSYASYMKLWTANPDDSQAWEPTDIDNGQFGMIFTYTTTTTST